MPERNEAKIVAEQLNKVVANHKLLKIDTDGGSRYDRFHLEGINRLRELMPITCKSVKSYGKKIVFEFVSNDGTQLYLVSTLGMEGKWMFTSGKASNMWFTFDNTVIWYDDTRHHGSMKIIFGSEEFNKHISSKVGPDYLDVTFEQFRQATSNKRIKSKKICDFLTDQKKFSGIGNYLRSEILYSAKIRPDRTLQTLSESDLRAILEAIRSIIEESYRSGGFTLKSWKDANGNDGKYKPLIYGKTVDPLGNKVEQIKSGPKGKQQTVYLVPNVQN